MKENIATPQKFPLWHLRQAEGQNTGKVPRNKWGGEFNCSVSEEASSILRGRTKSKH